MARRIAATSSSHGRASGRLLGRNTACQAKSWESGFGSETSSNLRIYASRVSVQNPPRMTRRGRSYPPGHSERPKRLPHGPESSHSAQKPSRNPELCWIFFWESGIFFRSSVTPPTQTRHEIRDPDHVTGTYLLATGAKIRFKFI